jgi:4-amino-4-deoxy-L-arabinose transferase-like glycosyltransferase
MNRLTFLQRTLFALAILLLAGYFIVYVVYAIELMRFPFDYDQGEGFELVDTIMFSHGDWPYGNNETYPFYASNYPPLFHVILVPFVWLFGPAYWYGRLVGFVGTLITASVIGYTVLREGHDRKLAILSGLAFLASNYIYHIGPLFRQHMTMVMFEALSVVILAHVSEVENPRYRRRTMIIGLLLLLAAGYTKQLALATVIAVFVFLFIRNPRWSIVWGVIFGAAAGALFLWINMATDGEWWANIIAANVNTYMSQQFVDLFKQWFRLHSVLIVMAGLLAAYELYFTRLSIYSIWWVLAVANSALSGKWGAGDSYFATAIAATCILSGIFAARALQGDWQFSGNPFTRRFNRLIAAGNVYRKPMLAAVGFIIPILYLFYGITVLHLPTKGAVFGPLANALGLESSYGDRYAFYDSAGWVPGYATIGHLPTQLDIDRGWQIVDILRDTDQPDMSEEAAFSLHADQDVITNPTQLKNLYENDMYDPANLIAAIQAHDFGVIVFRAQFYPPPVLEAVYEAYYPSETIVMNGFNYEIWRPGPPQNERTVFVASLQNGKGDQPLSLPFEEASGWLVHAAVHQNWLVSEDSPADNCRVWTLQKENETLRAELCPATLGSELRLSRGDK